VSSYRSTKKLIEFNLMLMARIYLLEPLPL